TLPGAFTVTPGILTVTQSQPAAVLPGQPANITVTATDNSSTLSITGATLAETMTGLTPSSANVTIPTIQPSATATQTIQATAPAVPARQTSDTSAAYQGRLAIPAGQVFPSAGTVTYSDSRGGASLPLATSSQTRLSLPRLSLGLSAPAAASPGAAIQYAISITNGGT